jgi:hypothetical protein
MNGTMAKLNELKWQILAAGVLLAGFLMARGGGLAALAPAARVLAPVLLIWLLFRLAKKKLAGAAQGAFKARMEAAMKAMQEQQQTQAGKGGKVIDLCPTCGGYQAPGHKCKAK